MSARGGAPGHVRLAARRLVTSWTARRDRPRCGWGDAGGIRSRRYGGSLGGAFADLGLNRHRPFFAHRVYRIPRAGPDALQLADWMCGVRDPDRLWLFLLHAEPDAREGVDPALFDDPEIQWHGQSHGLPGHVAYACAAERGRTLYALCCVSDLVQRISRRREWKTRVDNSFGGWPYLLLNAMLDFAAERGARKILLPGADLVLRHADPERDPGRELFERVYDRAPRRLYAPRRDGAWWSVDVPTAHDRLVPGVTETTAATWPRVVCVSHDTEAGLGHRTEDPAFAAAADRSADAALDRMLAIEARLGVRTTYQVVGARLGAVAGRIAAAGHAVGFHSWDHVAGRPQLARCRRADGRIRGYRPPRSRLTRELTGPGLARRSFEWLASSGTSLGHDLPRMSSGVVRIPIARDDYALHAGTADYSGWRDDVVAEAGGSPFYALGLHDCYADRWLDGYEDLLEALLRDAEPWTMGEVSDRLGLCAAE